MRLVEVNTDNMEVYMEVGKRSYNQHYRYLWPEGDTSPYINTSFKKVVVEEELKDTSLVHFIVMEGSQAIGIIKLIKDAAINEYSARQAILLEKIYILEEYTGLGLGKKCLDMLLEYAVGLDKKILWLDTMVNGRALPFYLSKGFRIVGEKVLPYREALEEQKAMYILAYSID